GDRGRSRGGRRGGCGSGGFRGGKPLSGPDRSRARGAQPSPDVDVGNPVLPSGHGAGYGAQGDSVAPGTPGAGEERNRPSAHAAAAGKPGRRLDDGGGKRRTQGPNRTGPDPGIADPVA